MTTNAREPRVHPVPILSLRPTQMTVGMREVKEKRKRWREHDSKKQADLLGKHMIPVVYGPDKRYYVIDHHHLGRALHDEGVKEVLVTVVGDLRMVEREAFWGVMDNKRWVYTIPRAKGGRSATCRNQSPISGTIPSAASPASSAAWGDLPRTPRRSPNSCGPTICAGNCRARRWMPISTRRWKRRCPRPRARMRSICRAGAGRRTTIRRCGSDQSRWKILAPG
ncbi:hypothetical protein ACVMHR_004412 [Bradyrhizobium diazoefficiens]